MNFTNHTFDGKPVAKLSVGCMRYKNRESVPAIIQECVEHDVLYLDTAPGYCYESEDENCETWIGAAIQGIHDKVILSAKCSNASGNAIGEYNRARGLGINTAEQVRKQIEQSLRRLNVDCLDFYQLWGINNLEIFNDAFKPGGWMEGVRQAIDKGFIKHLGITGHVPSEEIKVWIDSGYFEMITVPFHLLDATRLEGIRYAHEKGVAVIAMNPLAGGILAGPSQILVDEMPDLDAGNASDLALRFVTAFPSVSALSGMTSVDEVKRNIASTSKPLWSEEQALDIKDRFLKLTGESEYLCTLCGYCLPCPERINIPRMLHLRTVHRIIGFDRARELYRYYSTEWNDPTGLENCTECGECESRCTNQLPIIRLLREVRDEFEGKG